MNSDCLWAAIGVLLCLVAFQTIRRRTIIGEHIIDILEQSGDYVASRDVIRALALRRIKVYGMAFYSICQDLVDSRCISDMVGEDRDGRFRLFKSRRGARSLWLESRSL